MGDIVSFNDGGSGGGYPVPIMARGIAQDETFAESPFEKSFAPDIAVGEDTITAKVTITYQLK